jgi:hypothetical protein
VNKPTDVEIEAAAQAIFKTWADENRSDTTWAEALVAEKSPDLYPTFAKVAQLARKEARAALIAAADARAAQLEPPKVALAKALPMPPYEYQPYYTGSSSTLSKPCPDRSELFTKIRDLGPPSDDELRAQRDSWVRGEMGLDRRDNEQEFE